MFVGNNNSSSHHEGAEGRRRDRERTPSKSQPPVPANVQQLVSSVSPGSSQEQSAARPLPPRDISLPTLAAPVSQLPVSYPLAMPPPVQLEAVPEAGPEIPSIITSNRYTLI